MGKFRLCSCIAALFAIGIASMSVRVFADGPTENPPANEATISDLQPVSDGEVIGVDGNLPGTPDDSIPAKVSRGPRTDLDPAAPRGPGADDCANATAASDGANPFDTTSALPDGPTHTAAECQVAGNLHNNVWFTYTATCTGLLTVTTCEELGGSADYDTRVAVYSGTCGSLTLLGCNDDDAFNACGGAPNYHSTVQVLVTSGTTYRISVGGFDDFEIGTGSLFISCNGNPSGACCLGDGTCQEVATDVDCASLGGLWNGYDSTCAETTCPCGQVVYSNPYTGGFFYTFVGVGNNVGNGMNLASGNRALCRIDTLVRNATAPAGTPYQLRVNVWTACPSTQSPPVTACGSSATLLYTGLMDAPLLSDPTPGPFLTATFNLPNVPVPNQIFVTVEPVVANTHFLVDGTEAIVGQRASSIALCLAGNSGCGWVIGGVANVPFVVFAKPILEPGACCDISDGTCTNVAGGQPDCVGATKVFTYSGFGGNCSNPNYTCVALLGACCDLNTNTCTENVLPDACTGAGKHFALGRGCDEIICPPTCMDGGDGQLPNYAGNGVENTVGRTSDLSTTFAGFLVADNVTPVANGTINSVRWWGAYRNFGAGNVPCNPQQGDVPDNFRIRIWNEALNLPYQILATYNVGASAVKVDTGLDLNLTSGRRRVYQYTFTGLNFPVQADICYWIEIVNNTTGGQCQWLWLSGPAGDSSAAQHTDDTTSAWIVDDLIPHDMAICVDVSINDDGCDSAIELPGACCLSADPFCTSVGPTDCANLGGEFTSVGQACPPINQFPTSPICQGACCVSGSCEVVTEADCDAQFGTFFGVGSTCGEGLCFGACCLADGACVDNSLDSSINAVTCESTGLVDYAGSWLAGSTCANSICATYDQCDPDGLGQPGGVPLLSFANSPYVFNNTAQYSQEFSIPVPSFPDNPDPSCYGGTGNGDGVGNFWVAFTGTGGSVEVSTCNSVVSDTVLAIYTYGAEQGCPTLLTLANEVGCSEDDDACADPLQSRVCLESTVNGQTYYVQVTSFDAASVGLITLNLNSPCPVACACPGDVGGPAGAVSDGSRDGLDVQEFVRCLLGTGTNCDCADASENGDLTDIFGANGDIAKFVEFLLAGPSCP